MKKQQAYTPEQARFLILSGKLPPGATVVGNMFLSGCVLRQSIPEDLEVVGSLDLSICAPLQSLPKGLKVGGSLDLDGCTSLKYLPEDLMVDGSLDLRRCTSIGTLPEDLVVGRKLCLYRCTGLKLPKGVPEGVKGGIISDESFFRSNKDHLLLMVNCKWGNEFTKEAYLKVLSER